MKKIILLLVMMLMPMMANAGNTGTTEVVTLTTKGQLQSTLLDLETNYISSLTIKGPINGKDIQYLRSGIGKLSKLEELNLSDVELVADEEPYCVITSPVDGTFYHMQYTYYISDKNSTEYLGVSSISMAATSLYRCTSNRLDQLFNESEVGKTLKKVTMPRNFTTIGEGAFKKTSVETVVMENPVKEIGTDAFNNSQIKLLKADWSQLDYIGSSAFRGANDFVGNKENNTLDINRIDSIPDRAFSGCNIKKVILSPNLWYLGDGALCCDGLEEANVPSTLEHLWYESFSTYSLFFKNLPVENNIAYLGKFALCVKERLSSPTTLKFKEGTEYIVDKFYIDDYFNYKYIEGLEFPSTLKRIGESAFTGYGGHGDELNIKSIAFPEGLEEIGYQAFYHLTNLEKVSFPSTLKKIGQSAFEGCGLLKVVIPEAVTEIGNAAFMECKSLQRAEFNAKHVYDDDAWHNWIFRNCSSLEKVTIGPKVEVIPKGMCYSCGQLIKVDFMERDASAGKLQINEDAFANCKIEEILLPEGLDSLGEDAFRSCRYLTKLILPNSLIKMGFGAFSGCTKLKTLTIPPYLKIIYYKSNRNTLGNGAFDGCTALESLSINSEESFVWTNQNLLALKEVTFGSNVKTINERAFYNMATIEKVNFSEGLETICSSAFSGCGAITSLSLPTSLKSIGSGAFLGCESLSSPIVLPMNLISLGSSAFKSCTNLPAITLSEELGNIGNGTFCKCTAITEITIPKGVSSIGEEAFLGCTGLTALSLSENLKSIGNYAFYDCTGLTEVELKDNVETIGNYAFCGCTNIKTFFLGKSVTSIGESAFKRCGNLMSVYCYALEIPSVGFLAFQDSNLDNAVLYVSKGSKEKYKKAYGWSQFKNIVEMKMPEHILTYIVDGEVYKTYSIEEGETITPEPAPTKEGYTFSGWSKIPETMPAKDVTVTGSFTKNETTEDIAPITIGKFGKVSYCGDKSLDFSFSDEIKAYIATGFDKDEGTIWLTRVKDVPAGVPVLIKGEAEKTYNVPVTDSQNSYYTNMFVGNTTGETVQVGETDGDKVNYYLSGDGTFKSVNKSVNIGNNKSYLQLPGTFNPAVAGETQKVTIKASGKASYAAPVDLDFTNVEGLKAFTATGYDKSSKTIWLTRVMKVQKGEGVLLKGDAKDYQIPSTSVQSSYMNMFVGNTSGVKKQVQETSEDGSQTNFYLNGDGSFVSVNGYVNISNNKCYLELPTSMVAVASTRGAEANYIWDEPEIIKLPISFRSIDNDGDGTTGINVQSSMQSDNAYYTLQGQRVEKPGKGLYIKNGKKIVIK